MGHVTVYASRAASANTVAGEVCPYAWGIYRDNDLVGGNTELPPFSLGYSNSWMVHKSGVVASPTTVAVGSPQTSALNFGDTDLAYRRYELNLRRYKRTLDSFNDTLLFVGEHATGAVSTDVVMFTYFRMLLLE